MESQKKNPDYEKCLDSYSDKQFEKAIHVLKSHYPDAEIEKADCDNSAHGKKKLKLYFSEGSFTEDVRKKVEDIIHYAKLTAE